MKKSVLVIFVLSLLCPSVFPQIVVTSPTTVDDVKACADYADEILLDRWDMNTRTDLGWRINNTIEQPKSYLTNISFQNGIFSAQSVYTPGGGVDYSDANISILDSPYLYSAMLGKTGKKFPIDADKYTVLVIRMYLEPDIYGPWGQLLWSTDTIYNGITTSGSFVVKNNWIIYFIDIPALGVAAGSDSWSGYIDSLRLDPILHKDKQIKIDWIRLVESDASNKRTITWTGNSGWVDIYLDNDTNPANGNLGLLAENVSGTSHTFLAGGLAPGDYYVAIALHGTSNYSYSPGYFHINDVPIFMFTHPSAEGSTTDFITVTASDPWDMANAADVEHTELIQNPLFTSIDYEDLVGNVSTNHTVYKGTSVVSPTLIGDPQVFFLHFLYRGATYRINTSKYHNLVLKMGIDGTQSVNDGSIARVIWKNKNEAVENVSEDIIIRHLPNKWVMNKIVIDMNNLPIEQGVGSPSHSGWTGELDGFRIDPHEFPNPRDFFFDDVKLTTDVTANTSLTLEWTLSDSDSTPLVSLYYDNNNSGYDGTLIVADLSVTPGSDSYTADVSLYDEGKYWLYAIVSDGTNENRAYSTGPFIIDHNLIPTINLSKRNIYLGAEQNGPTTSKEKVFITNSGLGALNWQAATDSNWIGITPTSGTGNGFFEINIQTTSIAPGNYSGQVTVSDTKALNSPQIIDVFATIYNPDGDSFPFGVLDTPLEGSTLSGSVAVTGWALDDIEVNFIEIKRDPDPDDNPAAIGSDGLVHIGYAFIVQGSRTDIEALYFDYPHNNRAGWGYMMLTFGLPRRGNGSFKLYAFAEDLSGKRTLLGTKDIVADNSNSVKPFGAIDTPGPGQTWSGTQVNFGWALTPPPKWIPYDGSTIYWSIDSVIKGKVDYGDHRADIEEAFPEYLNSAGAGGHKYIDTTQYTNSVHTIGWLAYDSDGVGDGMGSRFFEVQNLGSSSAVSLGMESMKYAEDLSGQLRIDMEEPKVIEVEELGYIKLTFKAEGGSRIIGWGEDQTKNLPIGSTLDQDNGIFYWMPGPGFLNQHILHFAVTDGISMSKPIQVVVNIVPKRYETRSNKKIKK